MLRAATGAPMAPCASTTSEEGAFHQRFLFRVRHHKPGPQPLDIAFQAGDPMRRDPHGIGHDQNLGGYPRILIPKSPSVRNTPRTERFEDLAVDSDHCCRPLSPLTACPHRVRTHAGKKIVCSPNRKKDEIDAFGQGLRLEMPGDGFEGDTRGFLSGIAVDTRRHGRETRSSAILPRPRSARLRDSRTQASPLRRVRRPPRPAPPCG